MPQLHLRLTVSHPIALVALLEDMSCGGSGCEKADCCWAVSKKPGEKRLAGSPPYACCCCGGGGCSCCGGGELSGCDCGGGKP